MELLAETLAAALLDVAFVAAAAPALARNESDVVALAFGLLLLLLVLT
jgi:hypothetical protein